MFPRRVSTNQALIMLQHKTKTFIADLWFVFAMLTPIFTPILLVGVELGGPLLDLLRAMLSGPLSVWFLSRGYPVDFTMLCALPTLFVAVHACILRLVAAPEGASPWRFWVACVAMLLTHGVATLTALLLHAWRWPEGISMGLWGGTLILYVVMASMWCVSRRLRGHAFEMIFGLVLTEHVAMPMLGYLFTALW